MLWRERVRSHWSSIKGTKRTTYTGKWLDFISKLLYETRKINLNNKSHLKVNLLMKVLKTMIGIGSRKWKKKSTSKGPCWVNYILKKRLIGSRPPWPIKMLNVQPKSFMFPPMTSCLHHKTKHQVYANSTWIDMSQLSRPSKGYSVKSLIPVTKISLILWKPSRFRNCSRSPKNSLGARSRLRINWAALIVDHKVSMEWQAKEAPPARHWKWPKPYQAPVQFSNLTQIQKSQLSLRVKRSHRRREIQLPVPLTNRYLKVSHQWVVQRTRKWRMLRKSLRGPRSILQ